MKKLKRLEKTYYYKVMRALVCVCACAMYILGLHGCNNELESVPVELELRMAISASGISNSQGAPSVLRNEESDTMQLRAFGDPGTTETFDFPKYAYIFMVWSEDGTAEKTHIETFPRMDLDDDLWERDENTLEYSVPGDPVYVYTQKVFKLLDAKVRKWGRLYVAVSKEDIAPYVKGSDPKKTTPTSETDVQNLVFDNNTRAIQGSLQDIDSTPYNYNVGGKYYGEIANFAYNEGAGTGSNVAYANLLLYHVAAKVDVMWNVAEGKRSEMKLSYIAAEHLYDGPCLLFRPMENEPGVEKYTSGYTKELATNDIGTQWNGRAYFYTIPYKNNAATKVFPLQLCMLKNGDSPKIPAEDPDDDPTDRLNADYYHLIQNTSMPSDAVFMPWIRCQMKINKELEYSATPDVFPKLAP